MSSRDSIARLLGDPYVQSVLERLRGSERRETPPPDRSHDDAIRGFILNAFWEHEITGQVAAVLLGRLDKAKAHEPPR